MRADQRVQRLAYAAAVVGLALCTDIPPKQQKGSDVALWIAKQRRASNVRRVLQNWDHKVLEGHTVLRSHNYLAAHSTLKTCVEAAVVDKLVTTWDACCI